MNCTLVLSLAIVFLSFQYGNCSFLQNSTTDRTSLLAFRAALSDPLGSLKSWGNESLHFCEWTGVLCLDRQHPLRVTVLNLESFGLIGPISPYIANLTFLHYIHIPYNHLSGFIPTELGQLAQLGYLNLTMNSLEGEIPSAIFHVAASSPHVLDLSNNKLIGSIPLPPSSANISSFYILDLSSNTLTGPIPPWMGSNSSSVSYLDLSKNSLTGSIPPSLGTSSSLISLDLSNNSLTGNIPPSLGHSKSLEILRLSVNKLSGVIPPSLGNSSSLRYLILSSNNLSGDIPPFSALLSPLILLGLSTNQLSGPIPPSLGNLSSLCYIYLAENELSGSIPGKLGSPRLEELNLQSNNLSGEVPPSLYNHSSMEYLDMGFNGLSGVLPQNIGITLPNLQFLVLQDSQFHGPIPTSLSNASGLQELNLAGNAFTGLVPSNLGSLQYLQNLYLGWNQLQNHGWEFLSSLTNCSLLKILNLQDNGFEGAFPQSISNLTTQLEWLMIGQNRISGSIPADIGKFVNLIFLFVHQNNLAGNIPAAIGKLSKLQVLNLSSNRLSGLIPLSMGNLTQSNELYMEENELVGPIPASFESCRFLNALNLSHNALGGSIPTEIVSMPSLTILLDLSYNSLTGSLPVEVGRLVNLGHLDVSGNRLCGEIPPTLGNCLVIEKLQMRGNLFEGEIPETFTNLKGMKELDLSDNNLSGRIPEFLETFGSLYNLNLSFNDFEGNVPKGGVFHNATGISLLGNKRLCGGDPMLQLPSCANRFSERSKNSHILITVLPIVSGVLILLLLLCLFSFSRRQRKADEKIRSLSSFGDTYRKVSYSDISKATNKFSLDNFIGAGSYGSVYKGVMEESIVAVKVLDLHQKGALKSFIAECEVQRSIRHRNIVKILTLCSSVDSTGKEFKALIYDFMPNGNLEKWLHPESFSEHHPRRLNLIQRLNVAIDVASALDYLHHNCVPPVLHCDIKPSNILLDNNMVAHVGDFGLARFFSTSTTSASKNSSSLMGIKGSIGYIPPEYGMGSQISTQGDVYSYGVLLLEIFTGRSPRDGMFKDGLDIHKFVETAFPDRIMEILDPQILQEDVKDNVGFNTATIERNWGSILSVIRIGLSCSKKSPQERMEMRDVSLAVHAIKEYI